MDESFCLFLDRTNDIGMAMPGGDYGNAGGEIQKEVPSTSSTIAPCPRLATSG